MSEARKTLGGDWGAATGVAAAMVIAVLINVLSARHYKRFDWTESGLYTLSGATKQTLADLAEPIEVTVVLASGDPLELTVRHLLDAYRAQTSQLVVRFIDPDRDAAAFLAAQQKYKISLARDADGGVVTDAAVIVARGERRHFISASDLIAFDQSGARPRVERVLTAGLRRVVAGDAPTICFTQGHGEPSLEQGGAEGLLALVGRLEKNNYRVRGLELVADLGRVPVDPINDCRALVVASPSRPVAKVEVRRWIRFARSGGNVLLALGPVPNAQDASYRAMGMAPLFAALGVDKTDDVIFERDDAKRISSGFGETLIATLKPHPTTEAMMQGAGMDVVLTIASSLTPVVGFQGTLTPLLATSDKAFGMVDFFGWAKEPSADPEPRAEDRRGPLILAYASERRTSEGKAVATGRSGRGVIVASSSVMYGANWQNVRLGATALFVESAIGWLSSSPIVLDIPAKPSRRTMAKITKQTLQSILSQVVFGMPAACLALGLFVRWRRRRGGQRVRKNDAMTAGESGGDETEPGEAS